MSGSLLFTHFIYICTWSIKARWTVRAKTLDQRQFNIKECPTHAHFYVAEFRLNYECIVISNKQNKSVKQ